MVDDQYEDEHDDDYSYRVKRELKAQQRATYGNWVQKWMHDESFWRAVSVNFLSGVLLASFFFLWAVALGFVKPWVLAAIVTVPILLLGFVMTAYRLDRARDLGKDGTAGKFHPWRFLYYELTTLAFMAVLLLVVWGGAWIWSLFWH